VTAATAASPPSPHPGATRLAAPSATTTTGCIGESEPASNTSSPDSKTGRYCVNAAAAPTPSATASKSSPDYGISRPTINYGSILSADISDPDSPAVAIPPHRCPHAPGERHGPAIDRQALLSSPVPARSGAGRCCRRSMRSLNRQLASYAQWSPRLGSPPRRSTSGCPSVFRKGLRPYVGNRAPHRRREPTRSDHEQPPFTHRGPCHQASGQAR
jgi:hypothetical protein